MVVLSVYFARSITGAGVAVGGIRVAVGNNVFVAVGVKDAVGVAVGAGEKEVQETKKEKRKKERRLREKVILFCMDCILPLLIIFLTVFVAGRL